MDEDKDEKGYNKKVNNDNHNHNHKIIPNRWKNTKKFFLIFIVVGYF